MYCIVSGLRGRETRGRPSPTSRGRDSRRGKFIGTTRGVDRRAISGGPRSGAGCGDRRRLYQEEEETRSERRRRGSEGSERGERGRRRTRDPQHVGQVRGAGARVPERAQRGGGGVQAEDAQHGERREAAGGARPAAVAALRGLGVLR